MKTHISFKKVFWSFLIIAFLTGSIAFAAPVGKISAIEGRVDVLKAGKNVAAPVSLGAPVDIGDIYRTKSRSRAEITFNNNNLMKIAPATRIEIKEYMIEKENTSAVMRLYRGKVQAVAHQDFVKRAAAFAEGNKFEVHTPNAVAGIRGSDMIVGFTNGTTMVVFISGHGYLYNPASPQVFTPIVAGQVSFITGEGTPTTPVKASEAIISGEAGAFIQVVETKKEEKQPEEPLPPPPPPPPPEIITGGTNFTGTAYLWGYEGALTANLPDTGVGTLNASAAHTNPLPTTLEGYLDGSSDKGGAFTGPIAGVEGSWLTRLSTLYVEGGNIYFLTGDAPGTDNGSTFSISGTLGKSDPGATITLTPGEGQTMLDALLATVEYGDAPQFFPCCTPFVISNSGMAITPSDFNWTAPFLISNEGKKVAAIGNMYTGSFAFTEATSLPYLGYSDGDMYALGPYFYSHDSANRHFTIDMLLQSIGIDDDIGPYLGVYIMRYLGTYCPVSEWFRMAGAGTYVATPANFFGYWNEGEKGGSLYYNDGGVFQYAGEDIGYFGGTAAPWTSPASFIAMGTYSLDASAAHYLMDSYISGSAYPSTESPAGIEGYAGAIWKDGNRDIEGNMTTPGSISDGTLRAIYVSPPDATTGLVNAGIMKSSFTGSYYELSNAWMWGMGGTLTPTQLATGLNPDEIDYDWGSMWGGLSGTFGGTGSIYGWDDGSGETLFLYNYSTERSLPFGVFYIGFGNSDDPNYYYDKPTGNASWSAKLGGGATFGSNSEDEGYWLMTASGTWTDTGEITGNATGRGVTRTHLYDMEGGFSGVNTSEGDTWIGQVIGSYTGTPTDFGGNWSHCTLYNDYGYMEWNSEENYGTFGFVKRTDGNYNFLAIGEFNDYGYGGYYADNFGGPYLWSGNMGYGGSTANRGIFAFTSGIWKKANLDDAYGTMTGYTAAVYYTEDGKVGLIRGDLTGNFYDMYYDDRGEYPYIWGMWQVQSGTGGLTTIAKTAPAGFDASTASISGGPLSANLAGSFTGSAETGNTIFGGDYYNYSHTMFITYTDASVNKSLPFGVYNLKLTGYDDEYGNYYYGKPAGTSVKWSAKIGGQGGFGYSSSDEGYWLANIGSTWERYGVEPESGHEYGTINGNVSGTYITSTHMGTIQGPFYGLYAEEYICPETGGYGTWTGMSVGTYESTKPLTTSLKFSTTDTSPTSLWRALPGTYYEADFTQWDASANSYHDYEYRYIQTSGKGFGKVDDDMGVYPDKIYFPNSAMWKRDQDGRIFMAGWDIASIDQVRNLPGWMHPSYDTTFTPTWYSEWPGFLDVLEKRASDYLDAILGMTGYPWSTGGTPVYVIGKYTASDYTKPTIITTPFLFGTFYTPYVAGGTANGAYGMTLGGFITDDARGVQIAMRGLYVGPDNQTAGVLRQSQLLTGNLYEDINMWDAEGTLVATVMNSSFASNPEGVNIGNFSENIINGPFASQIMGRLTGDSGSLFGTMENLGTTRFIKGQDWGVFSSTIWVGGFGVSSTTIPGTWSAQVGAEGQFGAYKDASNNWQADIGMMLIPTLSGTLTGGVAKASYTSTVGQFMTMTKMGTISDVGVLGVYTQPETVEANKLYSWQGVMGGVWNTTQYFTFASSFDASTKRFAEMHYGGYSDGSYNHYYYNYDNEVKYGEISFFSDASRTLITQRKYEPDSGPFSTPMWYEYTYAKGTNTFSGYTTGTDYPSSFSDAFFSALAVAKGQPVPNNTSTWWDFSYDGSVSAIMGGVGDLWTATASSPATVYFLGDFDSWNERPTIFGADIWSYNVKNNTNTTLDGKGAYYGYIGGREIDGTIDGRIYAIYLDPAVTSPAGILKGAFTGTVYSSDIDMWAGQGGIYPIYLMDVSVPLGDFSSHLYTRDFYDNNGINSSFTLNGYPMGDGETYNRSYVWQGDGTTFYAPEGSWGVWKSAVGGRYYGITPTDSWTAVLEFMDTTRIMGNVATGTQWSGNKIEGTTVGYGADIQPDQTYTWVSVGEAKGTFNPTLYTLQLGIMGVSVETNTYLTLASTSAGRTKLQALGIPAVQVGVDTLTGSGNGFSAIAMNDVKFFATTAGGKPSVWATNSVTGTYTAPPSTSTPISMTGSALSASFNFTQWNPGSNGKWLGSVNGTGGFNGSTTFKGAAAGLGASSGSGSIAGTAAGVAK